jgi:hypothetical protein
LYSAQVEYISLPEFQMPNRVLCSLTILAASCALSSPLFAQLQTPPRPPAPVYGGQDIAAVNAAIERFGFDFVTVGAPGNRSWLPHERRFQNGGDPNLIDDRGRVDYEYRILRTEVIQPQYVDFVRAFRPFWLSIEDRPGPTVESGSPVDSDFTSRGISIFGGFAVDPRYDNSAVTISWRNAARYTNWLHNGAPTDEASLTWDTFHTGAYTFTDESFASNVYGNPVTRNEGARFWLPGLDELLKAAYYDPNRYGEGEEGYWLYPHSSNQEPIVGPPGTGDVGPTDLDGDGVVAGWERLASGLRPGTVSPWGLLDVLGTEDEWVETPYGVATIDGELLQSGSRLLVGDLFAEIDNWGRSTSTGIGFTFRLATVVPSPAGATMIGLGAVFATRRRRI